MIKFYFQQHFGGGKYIEGSVINPPCLPFTNCNKLGFCFVLNVAFPAAFNYNISGGRNMFLVSTSIVILLFLIFAVYLAWRKKE